MSGRSARDVVRGILPSHVELGSEGVHARPLTEDAVPRPLDEDYGAQTVGSAADFGNQGDQVWPGGPDVGPENVPQDMEESFRRTVHALNEYAGGTLQDDESIELFNMLVRTGLIEYMNDSIRDTARSLSRAGYVNNGVSEAEQFRRDVSGQDAQAGTPNIQVRSGAAMPKAAGGTAPVSTVSDIGSQKAQSGPAQVPKPPGGQVTSKGHKPFPDSGGSAENPAKIRRAAGTQKPGPNHGDDMSGGSGGVQVGNSLQQGSDPDTDDDDYEGSQVGKIGEAEDDVPGPTCPVPKRGEAGDEEILGNSQPARPKRRRRPPPARTRR